MQKPISVTYTFVDGAHFLTTDDPEWAGLCVASTNLSEAWNDVSVQLTALDEINHGRKGFKFVPAETAEAFFAKVKEHLEAELAKAKAELAELQQKVAAAQRGGVVPSNSAIWQPELLAA